MQKFPLKKGLSSAQDLHDEIKEYIDVLMGHINPPIADGVDTLFEVSSTYLARAKEIEIKLLERNNVIPDYEIISINSKITNNPKQSIEDARKKAKQKRTKLAGDSLLGLLAHSTLAIGLVLIGFLSYIRFDLMGLLFGDILAVTTADIGLVWIGGSIILIILYFIWKSLFSATVNYDLSAAEGMRPEVSNFIFTLLLAGVIALSIKMIGALLITGLLLIPAAIARNISNSPRQMIVIAILSGILSVVVGLFASLEINTSSGPSIIVVALILFIISLVPLEIKGQLQKR